MEKQSIQNQEKELYPPVLSAYTDFREYLKDFFEFKKFVHRHDIRPYSYATFSAAANIKSPNYLKLIIEGKRNLSEDMIEKFAKALGILKDDVPEFKALVFYGQAKEPLQRNRYLKDLADIRVKKQIRTGKIKQENFDKVPSWVSWVLFSLVDQKGAEFDVETLRDTLKNRATNDEIRKCLEKLLSSGELTRTEDGQIEKGRRMMDGAEQVPAELVRKLQAELIWLGLESLFHDDPKDREFGALTLTLTEKEFEELKFKLRHFRKDIYKNQLIQRELSPGDRVFQLNVQLFPVTNQTK